MRRMIEAKEFFDDYYGKADHARFNLIGDYRYGGSIIDGRKYSIIRNGDELLRVREVSDNKPAVLLWDCSMPMTIEILNILQHEQQPQ